MTQSHTSPKVLVALLGPTAFLVRTAALMLGPVSDTYGRRRVGLTGLWVMAVGIVGSVLAWNYGALLACRLLTGVGAAMIPPNGMAAIADHFPQRSGGGRSAS